MRRFKSLRQELHWLAGRRPPEGQPGWNARQLFARKKHPANYHHMVVELCHMTKRRMLVQHTLTMKQRRALPDMAMFRAYTAGPVYPNSPRTYLPRRPKRVMGFMAQARAEARRRTGR